MEEQPGATSPILGLSHAELLGRVALFAGLSHVSLARLAAYVEPESVSDGATVCVQGASGDSLYIVVRGTFGVFIAPAGDADETLVGTLGPADYFGEMALLTDEPRSATVRAVGDGEVLRLERERFRALFEHEPSTALTIAATLSARLRDADDAIAQSTSALEAAVEQLLRELPPDRRTRVLQASALDEVSERALQALFGLEADRVAEDLSALGVGVDRAPGPVLGVLRDRFEQTSGRAETAAFAEQAAGQLAAAGCWHEALAVQARHATRPAWLATLGQALRTEPPLSAERARRWLEHLTDEESGQDTELALARAALLVERQKPTAAVTLLRQALDAAIVSGDTDGERRISAELARLAGAGEGPPPDTRGHRLVAALAPVAAVRPRQLGRQELFGLLGAAAFLGLAAIMRSNAQWVFVLLLAAALALWLTDVFPEFAVSLGLVAAWIIWGIATPAQALDGFSSLNWIFVVSVLGIATAIARSGLLFRAGLLLVRRMPPGLFWQAGTLLLTGVLLSPLLPQNQGRAALLSPIALAVAEAARLKDREPAAAILGLAAWFGAGPLMFVFLNGSPLCLIAWGMLPPEARARIDWAHWFVAAAPLAVVVSLGALALLFLVLRPGKPAAPSRERVDVQMAVLGSPTGHEIAMLVVLGLTVVGFVVGPGLGLNPGTTAILGFIGAVISGNFDRRALQELDWNFLLFNGVVLGIAGLVVTLGLDKAAAAAVEPLMARIGHHVLIFVLVIACLNLVARLVLPQNQALLILGLALIPAAPDVGVDPWIVVITLLATSVMWFIPSQTNSYLVAYSAGEGRLFSHAQGRLAAFLYAGVTLVGLAVSVLTYWRLLGLT